MAYSKEKKLKTFRINISGIVQGVGFRPFIYKIARQNNFTGTVVNTTEGVTIKINASDIRTVNKFISDIKLHKPQAAVIETIIVKEIPFVDFNDFKIKKSTITEEKFQLISPDLATCNLCIKDINNKKDARRYYYPFTNCTNCGPRFTIIKKMPYDRPNTTMSKFPMCSKCYEEYHNPSDRRFHAQPIACNKCGPELILTDRYGKRINSKNPIITAAELINQNKIIAIKSLGGFQIACNTLCDDTVKELRKRKMRPTKPFAIMVKDIEYLKKYYYLRKTEAESLLSSRAPIVLIRKKTTGYPLSFYVSMYDKYEGVMLPYTPLHHLLFNHIDMPLIMTSGNISEEPIASNNKEALDKLKDISDYFLIHDRDIYSRYDDSVIKVFNGREMIIRRARGYSPYPVKLNWNNKDTKDNIIFSAGAHEKNTFCFLVKNYAIISQHIGDLDSAESIEFYNSSFNHYRKLFNIEKIDTVVCDKHPSYASTRFVGHLKSSKKIEVQHHKAHIASVIAENGIDERVIGFAWDGTGYGDDNNIWGSEIFTVDRNLNFIRTCHLKEKILPGGEITIKKPYRMAVSYLYNLWKEGSFNSYFNNDDIRKNFPRLLYNSIPHYRNIVSSEEINTITKQIETGFNSPVTTSMGRFFDAVSSLINCTHISTYEGEAAVNLEMIADYNNNSSYKIKIININNNKYEPDSSGSDIDQNNNLDNKMGNNMSHYIIDDYYILNQIFDDLLNNVPAYIISSKFHNSLVNIVLKVCLLIKESSGINKVALSGGVFQNNYLISKCFNILKKNGFKVYSNFKVPVNDGGISLGQAYIAAVSLG
ncbi:MAG: carbamoyltransferase HypF [Actinomycetota bacterium]|nr:carbamoyltransferase HypF [Actinomycetota bacterium]